MKRLAIPALPPSAPSAEFQRELIALIPHLRAFSRGLCRRREIAEDLAQEALAKAWRSRDRFELGTNLKAWLFTILRNEFYSHARRAGREVPWNVEAGERIEAPADEQEWVMALSDTVCALRKLPVGQREALILVGAGGYSHQDAAKICGTAIGTIKSRVARARTGLANILDNGLVREPASQARAIDASDEILAQLSALTSDNSTSATYA
jgi:RNA polymerase sigma-70 factor (ECF subfamily)